MDFQKVIYENAEKKTHPFHIHVRFTDILKFYEDFFFYIL